jgi:hypothetical protein
MRSPSSCPHSLTEYFEVAPEHVQTGVLVDALPQPVYLVAHAGRVVVSANDGLPCERTRFSLVYALYDTDQCNYVCMSVSVSCCHIGRGIEQLPAWLAWGVPLLRKPTT